MFQSSRQVFNQTIEGRRDEKIEWGLKCLLWLKDTERMCRRGDVGRFVPVTGFNPQIVQERKIFVKIVFTYVKIRCTK